MTIMILGAGVMQLPGIRMARRNGWRVVVVDGNPGAVGRDLGDRFEVVDLKDREGLCALARRLQSDSGLDGVYADRTAEPPIPPLVRDWERKKGQA